MDYHAWNISEYGVMWIHADGTTFRDNEERWIVFKEGPCNVNLSLVMNGVNPFIEIRSIYWVWPVFVTNNNLVVYREYIMK